MNSYVKVALAVIGLVVVGMGVCMAFGGNAYKDKTLQAVRYSYGGDMMGSHQGYSLERVGKGGTVLVTESREHHAARLVTKQYNVPADAMQHVKDLMLANDLHGASKRPLSKMVVLDAGTGHLHFSFTDAESFDVASNQDLTSKQQNGYRAVRQYLESLAEDRTPVSVTREERRLALVLNGYQLRFSIRDSVTEEDLGLLMGKQKVTAYADNEKIFYPAKKLDVSGLAPAHSGKAGTLAYYAPWGDVVIFYADFAPAPGLYELGELEEACSSALKLLADMPEGEYHFYGFTE